MDSDAPSAVGTPDAGSTAAGHTDRDETPDLSAPTGAGASEVDPPGTPGPPGTRWRRRHGPRLRWHPVWPVLGALVLTTLTLIGVFSLTVVPAPYVVYAPGSAIATEPTIRTPGTRSYRTEGEVLFLTVSVRGATKRVAYVEALYGWLRGEQDVYPRKAILGDQTGRENRQEALDMMAQSQDVAAYVALDHLGYDVVVDETGVIVVQVFRDTPAAAVLQSGDVIVAVEGTPISNGDELRAAIDLHEPGDEVAMKVERGGKPKAVSVELVADPDDPERALIGITPETRATYEFPFTVRIRTDDVGGPSAGLALTLGLIDHLSPGSLTGGKVVATTGTIDPDGLVGEVGGVGQKAVAARSSGAALMLVPASEAEEAREFAGDMKVVGVETLDDALQALADIGGNAEDLDRNGG